MLMALDYDFLEEVGLGSLDAPTAHRLLVDIYDQLADAVGLELASQLTDEQFTTFENLMEADDEPRTEAWLRRELPEYPQVVERQFERLRAELIRQAPAILDEPSRGFRLTDEPKLPVADSAETPGAARPPVSLVPDAPATPAQSALQQEPAVGAHDDGSPSPAPGPDVLHLRRPPTDEADQTSAFGRRHNWWERMKGFFQP